MKSLLQNQFKKLYQRQNGQTYFSPARVNLIGEHIDYNGGFVFPCALSFGTYGIIAKRDDSIVNVYSHGFSKNLYRFNIHKLNKDPKVSWVDYIKGVLDVLNKSLHPITHGFDLYIASDMPNGSGLSSSASLESLVLVMLNDMFQFNLSKRDMAILGKQVENQFIGVNSGIMDQFAVLAGKKDYAIMLNTATLDFDYIPLMLDDYQLLVINSNKKRGLADSKYNERFHECQSALKQLKPAYAIEHLCDLTIDKLPQIKTQLDDTLYRRVKHCITEQQRTLDSAHALKNQDIITFANLLTASHQSLKDDYEVTGNELDILVSETLKAGALGARMTGAGFGGCIVSIINKKDLKHITETVKTNYKKQVGYEPSFYAVNPSDGTHYI